MSLGSELVKDLNIKPNSNIWDRTAQESAGRFDLPTVGFCQSNDGKIVTLRGSPEFTSQRVVDAFYAEYDETRRVTVCPKAEIKLQNAKLYKGSIYNQLPKELRGCLEDGKIIVTASKAESTTDLSQMLISLLNNISILNTTSHVKDNPPSLGKNDLYKILHYSFGKDETQGRSGVLLHAHNNQPVIVEVDGKEYIIELKGCGLEKGGFGKEGTRSGLKSIEGAVTANQAIEEFLSLEGKSPRICYSAATLVGSLDGQEVGYILRLTPSTVRASYSKNLAFPDSREVKNEIVKAYAYLLIEQITNTNPYLMRNSAHHENILVSGNNQFSWTDFSDHQSLVDNHPYYNTPDGIKNLIKQVFNGLSEVPDVTEQDLQRFRLYLNANANLRGISLDLNENDNINICVEKIWENFLASHIFNLRRSSDFILFDNKNLEFATSVTSDEWRKVKEELLINIQQRLKDSEDEALKIAVEELKTAVEEDKFMDIFVKGDIVFKMDLSLAANLLEIVEFLKDLNIYTVRDAFNGEKVFLESYAKRSSEFSSDYFEELESKRREIEEIFNDGKYLLENFSDAMLRVVEISRLSYYSNTL